MIKRSQGGSSGKVFFKAKKYKVFCEHLFFSLMNAKTKTMRQPFSKDKKKARRSGVVRQQFDRNFSEKSKKCQDFQNPPESTNSTQKSHGSPPKSPKSCANLPIKRSNLQNPQACTYLPYQPGSILCPLLRKSA